MVSKNGSGYSVNTLESKYHMMPQARISAAANWQARSTRYPTRRINDSETGDVSNLEMMTTFFGSYQIFPRDFLGAIRQPNTVDISTLFPHG